MWKQFTTEGFLQYPNFLETVLQIVPMYKLRAIGGSLYMLGVHLMMTYNLLATAKARASSSPTLKPRRPRTGDHADHDEAHPTASLARSASPCCFTVLALVAVHRRPGGDDSDVGHPHQHSDHRQREALHAAGSAWGATSTSAKVAWAATRR
jgi:hypothetical protein